MSEKERIRAEMEAKMVRFDQTINELKQKNEHGGEKGKSLHPSLQAAERKKAHLEKKIKELDRAEADGWHALKDEIDDYLGDIDNDLREALAYSM